MNKNQFGYSELQLEAEYRFLSAFDPYFFVRALLQFQSPMGTEYLDDLFDDEGDCQRKEFLSDNTVRFEATRGAAARYFRYLNSETLIVLVCSGYPSGPTPKALSYLYPKEFEKLFEQLAQRQVPSTAYFSDQELPSDFNEWFAQSVSTGVEFEELDDYRELLVSEAGLLANREVVSSFKHGRALQPVKGNAWKISVNGGDQSILQPMASAVQWLNMPKKPKNDKEVTLEHGFEETDFRSDLKSVVQVAHVMDLIRTLRLQLMQGLSEIEVFLPRVEGKARKPQRIVLKVNS